MFSPVLILRRRRGLLLEGGLGTSSGRLLRDLIRTRATLLKQNKTTGAYVLLTTQQELASMLARTGMT